MLLKYIRNKIQIYICCKISNNFHYTFHKKNSKFKRPSGVTSVTIEKETYPTQLASNYTPSSFKLTEYYKSGYEPSEVSPRFDTLENPTNGKSSFDGSKITLNATS